MNYKMAVVEDNEPDILLLEDALKKAGLICTLTVLADGDHASKYIAEVSRGATAPDLVLLDMNLPKADGLQLLAQAREAEAFAKVPIVVWSSGRSAQDRIELDRYKITKFVTKPSSYSQFMEIGNVLRQILEQSAAGVAHL